MSENYYDILGVSKTASEDEIKKAFRKLAIETHPDKHPGDKSAEEKFKKINEAYTTLSDKDQRAKYDATLNNPFGGQENQFNFGSSFSFSANDMMDDMFKSFFNGRSNSYFHEKKAQAQPENLSVKVSIKISFEEAYCGVVKEISYNVYDTCPTCGGNGYDKNSKFIKCPNCKGQGFTIAIEETFFGKRERRKVRCNACNGAGNRHEKECSACKGKGRIIKMKTVRISIPAGAYSGMELKAPGSGSKSKDGRTGDLYILVNTVNQTSDGRLRRAAIDPQSIETDVNLSYYELLCGSERTVRLPNGEEKTFKIPPNTSLESTLRLKCCGFKFPNGPMNGKSSGDLFIHMSLEKIQSLTEEQRELLKKFNESLHKKS